MMVPFQSHSSILEVDVCKKTYRELGRVDQEFRGFLVRLGLLGGLVHLLKNKLNSYSRSFSEKSFKLFHFVTNYIPGVPLSPSPATSIAGAGVVVVVVVVVLVVVGLGVLGQLSLLHLTCPLTHKQIAQLFGPVLNSCRSLYQVPS